MLLREALSLARPKKPSATRKAALICSFEPLHLRTFLQGHLAKLLPDETPVVAAFGYDQFREALAKTRTELRHAAALICLSWDDLHPGLSWRSRGPFQPVPAQELSELGLRLRKDIEDWLKGREGAQSCLVLPPMDWLPHLDHHPSQVLGPNALAAQTEMALTAKRFAELGGLVFKTPAFELNYRELLQGGFPMTLDAADAVARQFVECCFAPQARKKALVLDLDGTLWSGVIGEDGPAGVHCRPEGAGHPHHVFQKFLKKLKNDGVLLALCSKNNPDEVLPHFDALEMPLRLADFAAVRCNWDLKSDNLRSIAQELNIGADSVVVVDDNDAELGEIRQRSPQTLSLKTPVDGQGWQQLFTRLQELFGSWRVGPEDRLRTQSIASRRAEPAPADEEPGSYLRELELKVTIDPDAFKDPRSLELINKTNQFNLTGERMTPDEWLRWAERPGTFCFSARLEDRFGDFGTVCVVTGADEGSSLFVRQFVLSCRAFGRQVEAVMLGELAHRFPREMVRGTLKNTPKNEPAQRFVAALGCRVDARGEWSLRREEAQACRARALEMTRASVVSR